MSQQFEEVRPSDAQSRRRRYEAPLVAPVKLEADEVLAIGCKMPTSGSAPTAPFNCVATGCSIAGS